jgi:hypothetical protein
MSVEPDGTTMGEVERAFREWYEETCGICRDVDYLADIAGTFDVWEAATLRERERCLDWVAAHAMDCGCAERIATAIHRPTSGDEFMARRQTVYDSIDARLALATRRERERCAKIVEGFLLDVSPGIRPYIAAAIREGGERAARDGRDE